MALAAINVTVSQSLGQGEYVTSISGRSPPTAVTTTIVADAAAADTALGTVVGADQTAVEAAVAVLEADGASPTQGHVNSLRTVWNTMKTDGATAKTATALTVTDSATIGATVTGSLAIVWDTSVVTNTNQLKAALQAALRSIAGSNILTA